MIAGGFFSFIIREAVGDEYMNKYITCLWGSM